MGTLSGELSTWINRQGPGPRVYADANVPAGVVAFMRERLRWDVFCVMEHPDLRRAADVEHYRLARQMHRTLITLDRDYFDDRRFPPAESGGVIVLSAPDERQLARVLQRVGRQWLESTETAPCPLPLAGRKIHAYPVIDPAIPRRKRQRR
jgi:hypothetical protein